MFLVQLFVSKYDLWIRQKSLYDRDYAKGYSNVCVSVGMCVCECEIHPKWPLGRKTFILLFGNLNSKQKKYKQREKESS